MCHERGRVSLGTLRPGQARREESGPKISSFEREEESICYLSYAVSLASLPSCGLGASLGGVIAVSSGDQSPLELVNTIVARWQSVCACGPACCGQWQSWQSTMSECQPRRQRSEWFVQFWSRRKNICQTNDPRTAAKSTAQRVRDTLSAWIVVVPETVSG